jgi:hypothetical protein
MVPGLTFPRVGADIAIGRVKYSDWKWYLRLDDIGLYRWYLSERAAMNIKGTSRSRAESALARFVQQM